MHSIPCIDTKFQYIRNAATLWRVFGFLVVEFYATQHAMDAVCTVVV